MRRTCKTIITVVCTVLVLGLAGCSKDVEDLIVGKWNVESITTSETYSNHPDPSVNGTHSNTTNSPDNCSYTYTFYKDNTLIIAYSYGEYSWSDTAIYSIDGKKLTINSNSIWIDDNGQEHRQPSSELIDVEKITKKELKLRLTESDYDDIIDGVSYHYSSYVVFDMKRD